MQKTIKRLGMAIEKERVFVTTRWNQYYDAFVRWQMTKMKIHRYNEVAAFVPSSQMVVKQSDVQMYFEVMRMVLIKMEMLAPFVKALKQVEGKKVWIMAEIQNNHMHRIYGQTNCWASAPTKYGIYMNNGEVFISSQRCIDNILFFFRISFDLNVSLNKK